MCQAAVLAWGLEDAIADVAKVAPLHRVRAVHAGAKEKRHLFGDLSGGIRHALCANNIWQSSMRAGDTDDVHEWANRTADEGSAWAELREAACTGARRRLTKKRSLVACPRQEDDVLDRPMQKTSLADSRVACPQQEDDAPAQPHRPAMAMEDKCVGHAVATKDKCVGESCWGDPFMWRTIFDM